MTVVLFPALVLLAVLAPVLVPWLFGPDLGARGAADADPGRRRRGDRRDRRGGLGADGVRPVAAMLGYGIAHFAFYVGAVLIAAGHGLAAVSAPPSRCTWRSWSSPTRCSRRAPRATLKFLWDDTSAAVCGSLALAAAAVPAHLALAQAVGPLVHLVLVTFVGLSAYALALRLAFRSEWRDLLTLIRRILPACSVRVFRGLMPLPAERSAGARRKFATPVAFLWHGGRFPDLSVIIVSHNGRELALATLRSARAAVGAITCEWLVVDNGSTDGTPDAIEREFEDVHVFRAANRGFAAGNNVALPHARGRYVLLLNPDVEIERGTFADLVAALDERPDVGIASVIQCASDGELLGLDPPVPDGHAQPGRGDGATRLRPAAGPPGARQRLRHLHTGAARRLARRRVPVCRRDAAEQVGPLDERFFLYAEETDWCLRFRARGWDVRHLPVMTITHHEGDSTRPEAVA